MESLERRYQSLKKRLLAGCFGSMNEEQRKAIGNLTGPVLILAGAGSGKTTVLVNRILNMISYGIDLNYQMPLFVTDELLAEVEEKLENGNFESLTDYYGVFGPKIKPWSILAITFTNKAAKELKERIANVSGEAAEDVCAGTFHWFCLKILRKHITKLGREADFTIYDADDSKRLIKSILAEQEINEDILSMRAIALEISSAKNNLMGADEYLKASGDNFRKSMIAKVYKSYQEALISNKALDFDDIIVLTVRLFKENPEVLEEYRRRYGYVMIDEYQDTNYCQFVLVQLLALGHGNICVVGDDDQSIYRFRGANIDNILNFEKHFKGTLVIRLEQNYRSTKTILNVANAVIANNQARKGKNLWTNNEEGAKVKVFEARDEYKEAGFIADNIESLKKTGAFSYFDCAVLYRTNAQSNVVETVLARKNIPYRIFGGQRFYDRKEIKDIVAYLNVLINKNDEIRLLRIINEPRRGIGQTTISQLRQQAITEGKSLYDALTEAGSNKEIKHRKNIETFVSIIEETQDDLAQKGIENIIDVVLEKTGYADMLGKTGREGEGRLENIKELKSNLLDYIGRNEEPTLEGFLNEISLYTDLENEGSQEADFVSLMTLHAAKGLEFDNVFILGMEDGLFPNSRAFFDEKELEEERRLAYVGFTRAKKQLFLVNTQKRTYLGKTSFSKPSRFMEEVPQELCEIVKLPEPLAVAQELRPRPKNNYYQKSREQFNKPPKSGGVKFKEGDNVVHARFGKGRVISVIPSGADQLLEVAFENGMRKKLMANYANLSLKPKEGTEL